MKSFWRCIVIKKTEMNEDIRDREVRVIGADGELLGVMSSKEALDIANEKKLDLVKIAPQARPPVCRIMDYGKHRYEMQKRIQAIRKSVPSNSLPNVYLLHGEFNDSEINELYNHPKVKSMVSLTKGEGFGRPLLEFSLTNKPVIASNWSGQTDFLKSEPCSPHNFLVHRYIFWLWYSVA